MADTAADAAGGKGAWTEAEKYSLLIQIIKQIGNEKLAIKFDQINLPGRTPKAMTHVWGKIRTDAAAVNVDPNAAPATPRSRTPKTPKTTTPKKKKADGDADAESPPKKRKATPKKKKNTKESEESEAMPDAKDSPLDENQEQADVEEGSKAEEDDDQV